MACKTYLDPTVIDSTANPWVTITRSFTLVEEDLAVDHDEFSFTAAARAVDDPDHLPVLGEAYAPFPVATCREITLAAESKNIWRATVRYSNEPQNKEEKEQRANANYNPLEADARISLNGGLDEQPWAKDADNKAPVNSAGDPIDPPPTKMVPRLVIRAAKNYEEVPLTLPSYLGKINDAAVEFDTLPWSFPEGTLLFSMDSLSDVQVHVYGQEGGADVTAEYRTLTASYHYREEGWDQDLLNAGFNQLNLGAKERIVLEATSTQPEREPGEPQLLSAVGAWLPTATASDATYTTYEPYTRIDFTGLPGVAP